MPTRFEEELNRWWYREGAGWDLAPYLKEMCRSLTAYDDLLSVGSTARSIQASIKADTKQLKRDWEANRLLYPHRRMGGFTPIFDPPLDVKISRLSLGLPRDSVEWAGYKIEWHQLLKRLAKGSALAALADILQMVDDGQEDDAHDEASRLLTGLYHVTSHSYEGVTGRPDQIEAHRHALACWKLDMTPAGARARDLLLDLLTDEQIDQLRRYGHFDVVIVGELDPENKLPRDKARWFRKVRQHRAYMVFNRRYRIYPDWPNGNVYLLGRERTAGYTFCLHPPKPYPTCDIAAAQKLLIEGDELQFWCDANVSFTNNEDLSHAERMRERAEFIRNYYRSDSRPTAGLTSAAGRSLATRPGS